MMKFLFNLSTFQKFFAIHILKHKSIELLSKIFIHRILTSLNVQISLWVSVLSNDPAVMIRSIRADKSPNETIDMLHVNCTKWHPSLIACKLLEMFRERFRFNCLISEVTSDKKSHFQLWFTLHGIKNFKYYSFLKWIKK